MLPPGVDFTFNDHRNLSHNSLHYLYFIMSIWHQPKSQDTSLEIHVRRCLMNGDVHWFPTGVLHEVPVVDEAKRLGDSAELEDPNLAEKKSIVAHTPSHEGGHKHGGHGGHGSGGHSGGHGGHSTPHHHDGKSTPKAHHQSPMFTRKSLIVGHQESSPMNELLDKMTNMQKQIMKLSKDIYQNGNRDRINSSYVGASFQAINGEGTDSPIPGPHSLTTSPQMGGLRRTIVNNNNTTTVRPSFRRVNSDDLDGDSGYSSTDDSDEDDDEKTEDQKTSSSRISSPADLKNPSPINGENGSGKPIEGPRNRTSVKTTRSTLSRSSVRKREKVPEVDNELQTKVNRLNDTCLLILNRLEMLEKRFTDTAEATAKREEVLVQTLSQQSVEANYRREKGGKKLIDTSQVSISLDMSQIKEKKSKGRSKKKDADGKSKSDAFRGPPQSLILHEVFPPLGGKSMEH